MASKEVLSALESLHRELEKLEPAIKHVEAAQQVTQIIKSIPQKHIDLLKEIKDNDAAHKRELTKVFEQEIKVLAKENKELSETTRKMQSQLKAELAEMSLLREIINDFHVKVEKINFPERLDKLDANVAGIMAAIQSVQSRLDNIERNITDRLKDIADYQKETRTVLQASVGAAANKQQIFTYVTWGLILIAIALYLIRK